MRWTCALFVVPLSCAASARPQDSATPGATGPAPSAASAPGASAGVGIDAAVMRTALEAPSIDTFELRVDAQGAFLKQSVYHDNAAAVPPMIQAKAMELFPNSTVVHFETEYYPGAGVVHEVEVQTTDGRSCEVSATGDGTMRYQECSLDPARLPAAVRAKIQELYPAGVVREAEHKTGPGLEAFIVEVDIDGRALYVQLQPDGVVTSAYRKVKAVIEVPAGPTEPTQTHR